MGWVLSIFSWSLDNLCVLGNWCYGCNGVIVVFLSEVLCLVGVCYYWIWRFVDSFCNFLWSYYGVRYSVVLYVWVVFVCKSVICVNSVWVVVVVWVIVGVWVFEFGVMWVYNLGWFNWFVE